MNNKITLKKNHIIFNTNRLLFGILVVFYYLFLIIFAVLSDVTNSNWILNTFSYKIHGIFAIILTILVLFPLMFAVYEVYHLIFKQQTTICCFLFFIAIITFYSSILPNIINVYFIDLNNNSKNLLFIIFICNIICFIFLILSANLVLKLNHKFNFKNSLSVTFLLVMSVFGFSGLIHITILNGWFSLLYLIIAVAVTDLTCYFSGKLFGKHSLAKNISPNKTIEGAIGGILITVIVLLIYCVFYQLDDNKSRILIVYSSIISLKNLTNQTIIWIIIFCLSISLVLIAISGDLIFSFIKRQFQIKDFSNFLKGHGGFLDRFDALLVSSFCFFIYCLFTINLTYLNS